MERRPVSGDARQLGVALIGAICRRGETRAWWLGFAAFGWVYMGSAFAPYQEWPKLPTQVLLDELVARLYGENTRHDGFWDIHRPVFLHLALPLDSARRRLRWLLGTHSIRHHGARATENTARSHAEGRGPSYRWTGLFLLYMGGLVLPSFVLFSGKGLPLGLWAGLTFFCHLVAARAFRSASVLWQSERAGLLAREPLWRACFLIVAFARFNKDPWPMSPTVELLDDLRPWLPPVLSVYPAGWDSRTAQNARVNEALERKVKMPFDQETALEDVIKHIQAETVGADGKPIAIESGVLHGGGEVNVMIGPIVRSVNLSGVPLRTSLKLCLEQLDCTFHVKDGTLIIHSLESDEEADLAAQKTRTRSSAIVSSPC